MTKQLTRTMRELRLQRNWTQAELAEKLNVTQGTISFWENGVETPSLSNQLQILEVMPEILTTIAEQELRLLDQVQALERQLFGGKCSCENCNCSADSNYTPISVMVRERKLSVQYAG